MVEQYLKKQCILFSNYIIHAALSCFRKMSTTRSTSTDKRQHHSPGSATSRIASGSKSSISTSSSPGFNRRSSSTLSANTRRRQRSPGGLSPSPRPNVGRRSRQSSASSGDNSAGFAWPSFADQLTAITDACEFSSVDDGQSPPDLDVETMRDDLSRRRNEHDTWRETFATRRNRVVSALEQVNGRRRHELKARLDAAYMKDATTEMDRVVLGSSRRWRSRNENGVAV